MPTERAVIWDIDGTIVSSSLERVFLRYLAQHGLVQPYQAAGRLLSMWIGGMAPPWYRIKLAYLRGEQESAVADWVEQCFIAEICDRLYPGAIAAIRLLHERDVPQLLLSGTLDQLAQRLARHLDLQHVSAARPEISGGRFTGALLEPHPHGRIKVARARAWMTRNGVTWDQVTAFADHPGDRFLLQEVGRPVAVNAQPELKRQAQKARWMIAADADLPDFVAAELSF